MPYRDREQPHQQVVTEALESAGLYRMDYRFERGGAQVLMNALASSFTRLSDTAVARF